MADDRIATAAAGANPKGSAMNIGTTVRSPQATVEVSVHIDGLALPLNRRPGDGAQIVAGTPGKAYKLLVRNLATSRAEVISTVDGRNTLCDEPGDTQQNRGLVFGAYSTGGFTGWRISDDEVREFVFGEPERSVAAQATGSAANVGVIGFAAYRERVHRSYTSPWNWQQPNVVPYTSEINASAATMDCIGTATASAAPRSLGTGIGERQADHVGHTAFNRADGGPDILVIGYDTAEVLAAMGVTGTAGPAAFPGIGTGYEQYQKATA